MQTVQAAAQTVQAHVDHRFRPVRVSLVSVPMYDPALRAERHFGVCVQFADGSLGVFEASPDRGRVRIVSEQAFGNGERLTVLATTAIGSRMHAILECAEAHLGHAMDDAEAFARRVFSAEKSTT